MDNNTLCTAYCGDVIFTVLFSEGLSRPYILRKQSNDMCDEKHFPSYAEAVEEQYIEIMETLDRKP